MKKTTTAAALAASTLAGIGAGAVMFVPGLASADDNAAVLNQANAFAQNEDRAVHLTETLQPLVDDGTLTEAQRDAVVDTLQTARANHEGIGRRNGGPGGGVVAGLLDMTGEELHDAIESGSTIADMAAEQGVNIDDIVAAIVDQAEARVATAVDSGRIDQATADEMLANAEARAQDMVNGERPARPNGHRPGGFGRGGHGPQVGAVANAS
jgi:hypothetical protein